METLVKEVIPEIAPIRTGKKSILKNLSITKPLAHVTGNEIEQECLRWMNIFHLGNLGID